MPSASCFSASVTLSPSVPSSRDHPLPERWRAQRSCSEERRGLPSARADGRTHRTRDLRDDAGRCAPQRGRTGGAGSARADHHQPAAGTGRRDGHDHRFAAHRHVRGLVRRHRSDVYRRERRTGERHRSARDDQGADRSRYTRRVCPERSVPRPAEHRRDPHRRSALGHAVVHADRRLGARRTRRDVHQRLRREPRVLPQPRELPHRSRFAFHWRLRQRAPIRRIQAVPRRGHCCNRHARLRVYETFLAGKYLNHYESTGGTYVPPGWSHWRAFASDAKYYNYDLSIDGTSVQSYGGATEDYSTDVIASMTDTEIRSASPQEPLFLWITPFAPHGPSTPAPRDVGTLDGIVAWRPPSYNEADVRDKPAYVQAFALLSADDQAKIDADRQRQLESLGAVDDLVGSTLAALRDTGRLGDTIIVFASDNGFLWGEHRREGKLLPYEESVRIPLVIRWDRLNTGARTDKHLVENIDLTPTLERASGTSLTPVEGEDLLPLLTRQRVPWRQHLLIEHAGKTGPIYCADRTPKDVLIHYATGEEEYYRVGPAADPFELVNKIAKPRFASRITTLRDTLRTMCNPLPPGLPPF